MERSPAASRSRRIHSGDGAIFTPFTDTAQYIGQLGVLSSTDSSSPPAGAAEYFGIYDVTSPTYAYLNVYGGFIYHYDCYRLSSGEEAEAMGLTEYFGGDNICFIEWAENIESALPQGCRQVVIEKTGEREREITL